MKIAVVLLLLASPALADDCAPWCFMPKPTDGMPAASKEQFLMDAFCNPPETLTEDQRKIAAAECKRRRGETKNVSAPPAN